MSEAGIPAWPLRLGLWFLVLVLGWCALKAALYSGYLCGYPYQVDSREAPQMRSALAMEQGRNPWAPAFAPQDYNCYGPLYPLIAGRLLPKDHQGIQDFRALSLAALALAALLVGLGAARLSGSGLGGCAGALAALGGYLFFVTPTARCDAFASLFFIAPLVLAILISRWPSLALCALLSALAFLVKPYAAAAGPLLCLVLWGQGRRRAALGLGLLWALCLAACVAWAQLTWPGYLESTVLLLGKMGISLPYLLFQTSAYLRAALPLLLLVTVALWRFRGRRRAWAWALPALAVFLLMLWLGGNAGALLEYHFQMLHPCLILAAAALWSGRPASERWLEAGLVWCALLSVNYGTGFMGRFVHADFSGWHEAEALVASSRRPLLPPLLTSVATDFGKPVADNGLSEFLVSVGRGPSAAAIRQGGQDWKASWELGLKERSVDLVVCDPAHPPAPALLAGYVQVGRLCVPELLSLEPSYTDCYPVYRPRQGAVDHPSKGNPL
ncbi:MAG TPA: hypothetical protein VK914_10485 [bacterium]|jgi:hypothetical protein|nr:hypothetical protein [bacterium]